MKRSSLDGLDALVKRLDARLSEKDRVREQAIALSRMLVRTCAEAIRDLRGEGLSRKPLEKAVAIAGRLEKVTAAFPELYNSGAVENALQELAEAHILESIVNGKKIPSPESFHCTPAAFLLGMGDAIGELRRISQDALRRADLSEAEEALHIMEGLYSALNLFDYPDAIVPLKHKQDVARGLIEKTRGEVSVAVRGHDLEKKIAALEKVLSRHATTGRR